MAEWPTSKPAWPVTVKQLDAFAAANPDPVPVPGQLVIEETTTISKAAWPEPKKVDVNAHLLQTVNANIVAREIEAIQGDAGWTLKGTAEVWFPNNDGNSGDDVLDAINEAGLDIAFVQEPRFPHFWYHAESDSAIRVENAKEEAALLTGEPLDEVDGAFYAKWLERNNVDPALPMSQGGMDGHDPVWLREPRTLMPSAELAHTFTKEPEVQANATLWPNDRGNGSKYYCGYKNTMNFVLLCGPYDTYEEAQERYDVAWERFGKDVALSFSFPVAFRDKKYMTVLTQPFTAALRKGSYGRL